MLEAEPKHTIQDGREANNVQSVDDARTAGWDPETCILDVDEAVSSAREFLDVTPDYLKPRVSAEIYAERKKQIAAMIDADFLLASYSGAKKMHETINIWLRVLDGIPYLSTAVLKHEIGLCKSLCRRSKMSFMPNERLIYVAYMEFNDKASYGDSFEEHLQERLREQEVYELKVAEYAKQDFQNQELPRLLDSLDKDGAIEPSCVFSAEELKELLDGLSLRPLYQSQIDELNKQLQALKPYSVGRKRRIQKKIKQVERIVQSSDEGVFLDVDS